MKPVEFRQFTPKNSRQDLIRRLEAAPERHVEALLASYELVQRMHDEGLIDSANGLLSAGGTVMSRIADVMGSAEIVATLRITFMLTNLLKVIDTGDLHNILSGKDAGSTSLVRLCKDLMGEDARVGLTTFVGLLRILGAALRKREKAELCKNENQ